MSGYQDLAEEGVRLKNRYKSLFRKSGKKVKGESLYNDESFLEGLERSDPHFHEGKLSIVLAHRGIIV